MGKFLNGNVPSHTVLWCNVEAQHLGRMEASQRALRARVCGRTWGARHQNQHTRRGRF